MEQDSPCAVFASYGSCTTTNVDRLFVIEGVQGFLEPGSSSLNIATLRSKDNGRVRISAYSSLSRKLHTCIRTELPQIMASRCRVQGFSVRILTGIQRSLSMALNQDQSLNAIDFLATLLQDQRVVQTQAIRPTVPHGAFQHKAYASVTVLVRHIASNCG